MPWGPWVSCLTLLPHFVSQFEQPAALGEREVDFYNLFKVTKVLKGIKPSSALTMQGYSVTNFTQPYL